MSEHIVHMGLLEDSIALSQHLPQIPEDFKKTLMKYNTFAGLGCITVAGDEFSFRLLEEIRPFWPERDTAAEAKLAFVLGWVSHRACDREMKPIWNIAEMAQRGTDANPKVSPTECSVYHEAKLYREYFKDDPIYSLAIFHEKLESYPSSEFLHLDLIKESIESSFGLNMMDIQTLLPPPTGQRFFEDLCMRAQKFYVDIDRYKGAIVSPDPKLLKEYVEDINWFCKDDPIVSAALALRKGDKLEGDQYLKAFNSPAESHYGRALKQSLDYFIAAGEFIHNPSMTQSQLKDRLDVGKLGRAGKPV